MHLKMLSAKWFSCCPCLNVLKICSIICFIQEVQKFYFSAMYKPGYVGSLKVEWSCFERLGYDCTIIFEVITATSLRAEWRLKSPTSPLFTQPFVQAQIKENIKAPRYWPFVRGIQRASNAENVSIWWRHHVSFSYVMYTGPELGHHYACRYFDMFFSKISVFHGFWLSLGDHDKMADEISRKFTE